MRTRLETVWRYYNRIDGRRVDLTDSQFTAPGALFEAPGAYSDEVSSRAEALRAIPQREYDALRAGLLRELRALDA